MSPRLLLINRSLIVTHWFLEGPVQPEGYWICGFPHCGRHRSDHVQARGQWWKPAHPFIPQRTAPSRCYTCGYHRLHSRHVPWRWDQYPAPSLQRTYESGRRLGVPD
jgi:hypothetical protein